MKTKITEKEVNHIAKLSKLSFTSDETTEMLGHLSKVLEYFETLDSVDTTKIAPTAHIIDKVNVLREDVKKESFDCEELIKNAPVSSGNTYVVPRVVE